MSDYLDPSNEELLQDFFEEAQQQVDLLEQNVLALENDPHDRSAVDEIFRAAHTLKAVAATVGHQRMSELTHTLETLFDAMREEGLLPTQAVTDELLVAVDVLKALRDEVVNLQYSGVDVDATLDRLRVLMEAAVDEQDGDAGQAASALSTLQRLTPGQTSQAQKYYKEGHAILEVSLTAAADCFAPAARLLQAAMALEEMGQIVAQHPSQLDEGDGLVGV